ncbi:hypothetical protein ThrDRAFT_04637 [Frankia casuarinae]|nr:MULTISPECIES: hypothetical protein [Frankia]ETA00858.1 hypothetical protein CcI6DRAFT_03733 [Frankia sp. CcI6]EYT89746.1 hypothetical protein ThrDRAFT_04637 [Frankia casuarinae]KDA40482.1 hypothetical protein BMG523Draft_04711 [Frankia sp. BMG5.23]TFE24352.1 hypothetical protein E0F15_21825 [Frankia sp. B2]
MPDLTLEGIFRLPAPVAVKVAVLASETPVRIGGMDISLVMPSLQLLNNGPILTAPAMKTVRNDIDWDERYRSVGSAWGNVSHFKSNDPLGANGNALVRAFVVRHTIATADQPESVRRKERGQNLYQDIDAWWRLAADWVEVVARQNLDPHYDGASRPGDDLELWFKYGPDGERVRNPAPISLTMSPVNALESDRWKAILKAASDGRQPPTEHLLLRDAIAANRRGQRRRAVLDAATAAEMALTYLLDQELAGLRSDVAGYVIEKSRQIGGRVQALKNLGVQLPGDAGKRIMSFLAEPRNTAIHGGREPSVDETREALKVADEIMETASPRSALL